MEEIKCDYCGEMYVPFVEDSEMCGECLWDMFAKALDRAVRRGEFND